MAYEAVLKKEPNRLVACIGALKSSVALGEHAKAEQYYEQVSRLTADGDNTRPELAALKTTGLGVKR